MSSYFRRSDFIVKPREVNGDAALAQVHIPLAYGVKVKYLTPAHRNDQREMLYHESEVREMRFAEVNKWLNFGLDLNAAEREIVRDYGR